MKKVGAVISSVFYNVLALWALALATVGLVHFVRLVDAVTGDQEGPSDGLATTIDVLGREVTGWLCK